MAKIGPVVFHGGGVPGQASYAGFAPRSKPGVILPTSLGGGTSAVGELGQILLQDATQVPQNNRRAMGVPEG